MSLEQIVKEAVTLEAPDMLDMSKPIKPLLRICGTCSKNFECYFPTTSKCSQCEPSH